MLHMMFKLGLCAESKWRKLRGFRYLTKVIKAVQFKDGIEVEFDNRIAAWFNGSNTKFDNNSFDRLRI